MATRWVSSSARGGDDGSDYANAWGTIDQAWVWLLASGTIGDIINIVNDGTHVAPVTPTQIAAGAALTGTDYDSDPGFVVRGTDTLGAPALTTVEWGASGGMFLHVRDTNRFIRIENFFFDMSTAGANAAIVFNCRDLSSGPARLQACRFKGYDDDDAAAGDNIRSVIAVGATVPSNFGEISFCVIENCYTIAEWNLAGPLVGVIDHCILWTKGIFSGTNKPSIIFRPTAGTNTIQYTNNTAYIDTSDSMSRALWACAAASGGWGIMDCYNNITWIESDAGAPVVAAVFGGSPGSTATWTGTFDFNVLQFGPTVIAGDVTAIHEAPWSTGGSPKAGDQVDYEVAAATLFVDPTTPYTWVDPAGTGIDLTVPADLRPLLHTGAGLGGSLPGALPAGVTDYTVTVLTSALTPEVGDTVVLTVTAGNSGEASTALVIEALLPAGLTYSSHVAAAGTYVPGTGLWATGGLSSGSETTLTINAVVDSDKAGTNITFTASVDSATPTPGPPTADDTDSVILAVAETPPVIDGEGDDASPFIDVLPLIAPVLRLEMGAKLEMIQSREREVYERDDFENKLWSEFTSKRLVLAKNTTIELNLGGIARGEYLLLDATTAVDVSASSGDVQQYWSGITALAIGRGNFERIHLRNTSLTLSSTILVGVTN